MCSFVHILDYGVRTMDNVVVIKGVSLHNYIVHVQVFHFVHWGEVPLIAIPEIHQEYSSRIHFRKASGISPSFRKLPVIVFAHFLPSFLPFLFLCLDSCDTASNTVVSTVDKMTAKPARTPTVIHSPLVVVVVAGM